MTTKEILKPKPLVYLMVILVIILSISAYVVSGKGEFNDLIGDVNSQTIKTIKNTSDIEKNSLALANIESMLKQTAFSNIKRKHWKLLNTPDDVKPDNIKLVLIFCNEYKLKECNEIKTLLSKR